MEVSSPTGNQGTIQEEEFMLACSQKKKEGERNYKQQPVCVFVDHSIKLSRSYDIIKTIPGHIQSHQPKSTISHTLSLP